LFESLDLTLEELSPADSHRLVRLVEACSTESQYRRFHLGVGLVSTRFARRLADLDAVTRIGYGLAEPDGRLAAEFRLCVIAPRAAEIAVLVRDDYQGLGLGAAILAVLIERARDLGIHELHAEVLSGNRPMIGVLNRAGAQHIGYEGPIRHMLLALV
jgi:RimJ/RimL family protein N-acetyltransferase